MTLGGVDGEAHLVGFFSCGVRTLPGGGLGETNPVLHQPKEIIVNKTRSTVFKACLAVAALSSASSGFAGDGGGVANKQMDSKRQSQSISQDLPNVDVTLWRDAVENCSLDGGGEGLYEYFNVGDRVKYRGPGDNARSLVFDPLSKRLVAQHNLQEDGLKMFLGVLNDVLTNLNLKGKGLETAMNVVPTGPRFQEVLTGVKTGYAKNSVVFEYEPNKVSVIDLTSSDVREYLASINLHNKLISALVTSKKCDSQFVEDAIKDAKSEVAAMKSCTGKINGSLPYFDSPVELKCDGRDIEVIGGLVGKM